MASSNDTPAPVPPEEFKTVIRDFISDIHCAFPEYDAALSTYSLVEVVENTDGTTVDKIIITDANYGILYDYCRHIYPSRFFDILYKNDKMFMDSDGSTSAVGEQNELNTEFLPNIDFKMIWKMDDISDNTKDTLWKYLQLILFSVVNNMSDTGSFGDTAKLFEAIDEKELKSKLEEVIDNMNQLFGDNNGEGASGGGGGGGGIADSTSNQSIGGIGGEGGGGNGGAGKQGGTGGNGITLINETFFQTLYLGGGGGSGNNAWLAGAPNTYYQTSTAVANYNYYGQGGTVQGGGVYYYGQPGCNLIIAYDPSQYNGQSFGGGGGGGGFGQTGDAGGGSLPGLGNGGKGASGIVVIAFS